MTPERIAEIRAMPHDNWRIVHELLEALDAANAELSRLRSSPAREREIVELSKQVATIARERDEAQGVDVPDLVYLHEEWSLVRGVGGDPEWDAAVFGAGYNLAKSRARLVPTPPQAATVPVVLNPPKQDKDCGDCTRLVICNGELACLCGPTGKMFDRKPDAPQSDAVVVPKDLLERLHDFVAGSPNMVAGMQLQGEIGDALRTSAQDETRG